LYKNKTYHRTGSLIDTLLGTMGDTIRWVNIVVLKKEEKKTLTGCGSVTFNGKTYNTSGTYLDSISSGACDTIYGLTVNLYPIQNTTINKDTFNSYTFKGTVYTTSQILKDTLKTINGCDSFISIDLKIKKLIKDSVTLSGCAQVVANGKTYTQNGVFKDTIVTATADTIRTLFITILTSTKDSISATACNDYRFGDSVYTKSGLYNYKFKTTKGCDSVIVLNLKINKVNKTVQRVGTQYISNEPDSAGVSFQWYICNPWRKISGATTRVFTTTTKASFAVEVKNNACADTSDCVSYNSSGIAEESINSLSIYPNPTSSFIQIDFGMYIQEAELSIFNVVGSQVYRQKVNKSVKETIDLSHLPSGSYLLKIRSEQFEKTVKISKF
jgi:aerobic-type carbon monoxide dehydrogenase small subunit (CoxS/CutS family)